MKKEKLDLKQKKKKNNYIIRLLILLVIAIISIIIILVIKNRPKSKQEQNQENNLSEETQINNELIDMNNLENAQIVDNIKENISTNFSKDRILEGMEITGIRLSAENGISTFIATITNNTGKDFSGGVATIDFINSNQDKYSSIEVYIPEVKNNETNIINGSTTSDIVNAYDFTINLQK